ATPARLMLFDLLADESGESLVHLPLATRRAALEAFAKRYFARHDCLRLSPATTDIRAARKLLARASDSLDGLIAKRLDMPYASGERTAMQKFKRLRTADCVVGGFRYAEDKP